MRHGQVFGCVFLSVMLIAQSSVVAQRPLVSVDELRESLAVRAQQRAVDIQEIQNLLSHNQVQARAGRLVNLDAVESMVPMLDDETLAELAERSREINDQLEGGLSTMGWVVIAVISIAVIVAIVAINETIENN